ncbi:copper chaperone CopZ [Chitinophaga skermanii]|uniref:Copper chaperone CopZ n=1 Tax=Chitinophaga skermanii TaxID=331697 RepID=A0A327QDL1_9BACT|nr:heavy-metal-associated domain-containing protein [Chitinophaga skermanii]RAI99736.1 copper chaperone CopZ [Chitinophaga skermanii]
MKSVLFFLFAIVCFVVTPRVASAQSNNNEPKKVEINITNLTCDGDMPTIKKQLVNLDGIEAVEFTKRKSNISKFTVQFDETVISLEQIYKAIETTPGCDDKSTTPYRVKQNKSPKSKQA